MKSTYLCTEDALILEFGYSQNLPLPKIPLTEQLCRRLLWMCLFNIHVHGASGKSYMFHFLQGMAKKGASTVCSFFGYVIQKEFRNERHKHIILLSGACGGQNRNCIQCFFFFCCTCKNLWRPCLPHVFSQGHSYSMCDRNLCWFAQKVKKKESI